MIVIDPILSRIMILTFGLAINAVCILAGIGHFVGSFLLYTWGGQAGMGLPTLACFLLTGTGFIIIGYSWDLRFTLRRR